MEERDITVSPGEAGLDMLSLLSARFIGESKTRLRRLVAEGIVRLNGKGVATCRRVNAGDVVSVPDGLDDSAPAASAASLEVLHEDEAHLVLNKPAGIAVVPSRDSSEGSLYEVLVSRLNRNAPPGGPYVRPHLVHRLDRETSGCLLVAKDERTGRALSMQFQRRAVRKTYLAIVEGVLPRDEVEIEVPIRRASSNAVEMVADEKKGKDAKTLVALKEAFGHFSLVELRPQTGRQHQIRLHMAAIGYPLVVDFLYGRRDRLTGSEFNDIVRARKAPPGEVLLGRCPLHAAQIAYRHPSTGKPMEMSAPLPADMGAFLHLLRQADYAAGV